MLLHVQNLRCGGCARTITEALMELEGVQEVMVDASQGTVQYVAHHGLEADVLQTLINLGYPPEGEANGIATRVRSLGSCISGKLNG